MWRAGMSTHSTVLAHVTLILTLGSKMQEPRCGAMGPTGGIDPRQRLDGGLLKVHHFATSYSYARTPSLLMSEQKRVLLVEDNVDNRNIYRIILEHTGYAVIEAEDGEEGIRLARELRPDLIPMDVSIPKIDGWEATKILKSDPATSDIPIVALTAHALASDYAKAEEAGCDGYLPKPVTPHRVVVEVERLLGAQ